ncbi:hypothetical protein AQ490_22495 [Wenjunlia vitaminophila]|uniref:Uncharacterized protein n=1 Tax=Wenjunlia vitaminophila TaxID=76728 RepID=A0A0T6LRZ6_WENVI|nr:hypothetical protein AQ490_22495 [Wenjunlia vitaminophila]
MLCLLALAIALIVWAVVSGTSGNSDNKKSQAVGTDGRRPAESITPDPGPSDSNAITERPGGRPSDDSSSDSGGEDAGGEDNGAENAGADPGNDTGGTVGGSGEDVGSDSTSGTDPGTSGGDGTAALPDCAVNNVSLSLRSAENSYEATERPTFTLTISNSLDSSCKVDLGQAAAVLTVIDGKDREVWASDDCPTSLAADLVRVPGSGKATRTYTWDRERSAPQCATPSGSLTAEDGSYEAEVSVPGLGRATTPFLLRS